MTRRAASIDGTRRQIAAAAARLHTTIGPANTSIAAIADEAGVTRLTVYRHFADFDTLFAACRAHWRDENPPPDPRTWPQVVELEPRARRAFAEWYGWYREHAEALFPIYRDMTTMPPSSQATMRAENQRLAALLCGAEADAGARRQAVARHLLDYRTWRSLAVDQVLTDDEVVEVAVRMLLAIP
jgi:AcrR family transcriptional regulator